MSELKSYLRFSVAQRVEHLLLILSFTTLALTGLPQKYPTAGISTALIALFGGIELTRIIHRTAAVVFMLEAVYHVVVLGYKIFVKRLEAAMLPTRKDLRDAVQSFLYNLGIAKHRPKMGRYNFVEKAEYWAMVWGMVIMALTGFMMWNPIATTRVLPGEAIPAAKAAHGAEAVLAVLAIFVWHFYHVHLKKLNMSMITGKLSREEMEEEHALELEKIEAGVQPPQLTPEQLRRNLMIYIPLASIVAIALLYGVYTFVTLEQTAVVTRPTEQVVVFAPQTSTPVPTLLPTSTPRPTQPGTAPLSWEGGIGTLFENRCKTCHGAAGGIALDSYQAAMKGGAEGPVILPGNAEGSPLVILQSGGNHPGLFSADELKQVVEWINAGAPER